MGGYLFKRLIERQKNRIKRREKLIAKAETDVKQIETEFYRAKEYLDHHKSKLNKENVALGIYEQKNAYPKLNLN